MAGVENALYEAVIALIGALTCGGVVVGFLVGRSMGRGRGGS